jgi:hypothetical protein
MRGRDQFGAALLRAGGEQFKRASVVRVAPAWAGGGSVWSSLALRAAAPALPTRGNSRSPSPSFCSPVIGPLNLSSAASRTRFIPKPCAGRWNVPGFGSRAGARNCSVGSRSCMVCLSRQREHSGNGQGRTRAPPAAYQFRRQADAPTDRARRLPGLKRNFGMVVTAALTSTSPTGRLHVRRAKGGITTVHPIGAKESRALRLPQRETKTASPYVFVSERGAPLSVAGYQRMVARAGEAARFHVPHSQPHAAPFLRLQARQRRPGYPSDPALSRSPLYCLDG